MKSKRAIVAIDKDKAFKTINLTLELRTEEAATALKNVFLFTALRDTLMDIGSFDDEVFRELNEILPGDLGDWRKFSANIKPRLVEWLR